LSRCAGAYFVSSLARLMSQIASIEDIQDAFEFLEDWDDRYGYLIDLGKKLPSLPSESMVDENIVRGCQSKVWLIAEVGGGSPPSIELKADSDAFIVKGLVAILLSYYQGKNAEEILKGDPIALFSKLGFEEHLSPTRKNGLRAMVQRVQSIAQESLS